MASSTLDPDNLAGKPDRSLGRGHGTGALGPSDSSDSGSDWQGAPGMTPQTEFGMGTGTSSNPDDGMTDFTASADADDAGFDNDTDSGGTGERATAARDASVRDGADIGVDHIEEFNPDLLELEEEILRRERPRKLH